MFCPKKNAVSDSNRFECWLSGSKKLVARFKQESMIEEDTQNTRAGVESSGEAVTKTFRSHS